jgi:hypothetical protein
VRLVSLLRRPAPAPAPAAPAELPTCDPCGVAGVPVEAVKLEGVDVLLCLDWRACITRAKTAGTWKP